MGADVRIEIIYFKQSSDIKLEFGLSSDYPIRLLTARANNEVEFIKRLKTASLRSPIIITVGGFEDGDIYLPEIIAKATNLELTPTDCGKYKTENSKTVMLPEGAVPIIYADGSFNGCVIESGPQSIIMLPEDDTNRLKLLKELIVPYISEHYRIFDSAFDESENDYEEPEETEKTEIEEEEKITENEIPAAAGNAEPETAEPEIIEPETAEPTADFDDITSNSSPDAEEQDGVLSANPIDDFFSADYNLDHHSHKTAPKGGKGFTATAIVLGIIIAAAAVVLGYCAYKYFF